MINSPALIVITKLNTFLLLTLQALVDVGDKDPSFVGSKKWIGSTEVGFCLDHLLGVTSKFLVVNAGRDLADKGRELAQHFISQGSPIMIGEKWNAFAANIQLQ